jgi:hypothetical protein
MSWLKMIVSKISAQSAQQMADVLNAMPPVQCLTAEPVSANAADQANKNPMEPRRYFVKTDLLRATLMPQSFTEQRALASGAGQEDENSTQQRRYFVKKGKWVDTEDEVLAARKGSEEEIPDKRPVDLKTLFPKLSLF